MSSPITVSIDADGTADDYLLLIVQAPTGVTYLHQCGGHACLQNSAEGFLVQIGDPAIRGEIRNWFDREFHGSCMNGSVWTPERIEALAGLVSRIACWHTSPDGEDSRHFLSLDRGRIDECVEAWIPALSPYGSGIVILDNSD